MNKERLLNVAKALRESKHPEKFTMAWYGHSCRTPACAMGHYAVRKDLQDVFKLDPGGYLGLTGVKDYDCFDYLDAMLEHFDITDDQRLELFGAGGCGGAKTTIQAAEYIEAFVAREGKR